MSASCQRFVEASVAPTCVTDAASLRTEAAPVKLVISFVGQDDGATAIEYGLIAAIIFLGIVGAVGTMGSAVRGLYEAVVTAWAGL
jgi:pilus assembly protein Flp/PilA